MKIEIIQANLSHATLAADIGRSSFHNAFSRLFRVKEDLDLYLEHSYSYEKMVRSFGKENNVYFLALAGGKAIGFAKLKKHSLHPQISSVWQTELQKIYVLPDWQGCGAGKELMRAVIKFAEELQPEYLWLDVLVSNSRARELYEQFGFRRHGFHNFTIGTQVFEYELLKLPVAASLETKSRKELISTW